MALEAEAQVAEADPVEVAQRVGDRRVGKGVERRLVLTGFWSITVASCRATSQIHLHSRWYLPAWDGDREDWRVFRTDRVTELQEQGRTFTPRALPADTGVDYLRQGINKDRERVVVDVDAPRGAVTDAFRHQDVEFTAVAENRTRAVLVLDSWHWSVTSLARLDAEFTVREPLAFRDACRRFGRGASDEG